MAYDPHPERLQQVRAYFEAKGPRARPILEHLKTFEDERTLQAGAALLETYFSLHVQDDLRSLRQVASSFADKRLVRDLVSGILADERALERIAAASYPHPIGFDKLVLVDHRGPGPAFKLRLHVYWRSPQEIATELIHLHRFEMASSPITGELTNHLYAVRAFEGSGISLHPGEGGATKMHAYTGYERDPEGRLRKRFMGQVELARLHAVTFVPGQTYAQGLEHAHYVETNAETGHTNNDVCSTIFIHGPSLKDRAGRTLPILFEADRVPDAIVSTIESLSVADLDTALRRYRRLLDESLSFYEWLYDEKYGRNLSVGLIAGYLVSEAFSTSRTIEMWEKHRAACVELLNARSETLRRLIDKTLSVEDLPPEDRNTRYFQQLVNKSWEHPRGQRDWLAQYGDLAKELGRYIGALIGDYARNPELKVLKPIWDLETRNLTGGAHYGHVWAMLEAARAASSSALQRFRKPGLEVHDKPGEGPVSAIDLEVDTKIRTLLREHFPKTRCAGEEGDEPLTSDRRWLIDPIDGTRNFISGSKNFALSIAHQVRRDDAWSTTDAVVTAPAHGEIYWAELQKGAYFIDAGGKETRLRVPADGPRSLKDALVDLSIRGLGVDRELALERGLIQEGAVRRATGCAALMLAGVCGHGSSGAVITANDYDVAAGLLVASEAGAVVSTRSFVRDGRSFTAYVIGASRPVHDALLALFDAVMRMHPPPE
jgi:fructose-1,6-bisphosphatase/inositol monophosphatase family enzyme